MVTLLQEFCQDMVVTHPSQVQVLKACSIHSMVGGVKPLRGGVYWKVVRIWGSSSMDTLMVVSQSEWILQGWVSSGASRLLNEPPEL